MRTIQEEQEFADEGGQSEVGSASARRSEIELAECRTEAPLIGTLTKPPSWSARGSFKEMIVKTKTIISRSMEPMDPLHSLDLKLWPLFKYHIKDWIFIVVLIVVEVVCLVVHPYRKYVGEQMFVTGKLRYPLKANTVPTAVVPVIGLVIPFIFILGHYIWKRNVHDFHHAVLGLFTAVLLTAAITDAVKDGLGQPRPDFYNRCFGSFDSIPMFDATGNVKCSGDAATMREAYKSFPSGHTSWSFAGMGYLSMYLAGKLSIFDRQGHSWKVLPVILPLLGAVFVGVSRIDDYWHHWTDVFAGAILGLGMAYFCYQQHFPSLFDELASRPYAHMESWHNLLAPVRLSTETSDDWPPDSTSTPYDLERDHNIEIPQPG
ncbi:unnamed protein product [Sphagnum jensenii]|uniref:Phosphatidic acid phosphatase type 2/haloperoxidase domain-containing protein n=1 Tax=Sphagnum jensenii TaxID=128206 RepID=A0ABP1ARH1_9BRYO